MALKSNKPPLMSTSLNTLHYVLVLDRSGSMSDQMDEVLGAINHQIESLRSAAREHGHTCRMTITTFDDAIEHAVEDADVLNVAPIKYRQVAPRGCTALIDATVTAIDRAAKQLGDEIDGESASLAIIVYTDGGENASTRYTAADLKEVLEAYQDLPGWDIAFIGSDPASFTQVDQTRFHRRSRLHVRKERAAWAMEEMSDVLYQKMMYKARFDLDPIQSKEEEDKAG